MTENTEESQGSSALIKTLAGGFAVFTLCYASFNFVTGFFGMDFDKGSTLYRCIFLVSYLLINVISWPIVKKYFN